jgi:hypothetical protein
MNKHFLVFVFAWIIQLSCASNKANETVKLYRQDTIFSYPSPPPPDFKIYGDDYQYAIQKTSYVMISGNDEEAIVGDKVVSSGIIILKNDTLLCMEDSVNIVVLFKRLDEYRLEVVASTSYYTEGTILYLRNVIDKNQKQSILWKDKMITHKLFLTKGGYMSVSYKSGIAKDTIFRTWKEGTKSPVMLE